MSAQDALVSLSAMFLLLGVWLQKRSMRRPAYTIAVLAAAVLSLFLYVAHYVSDYFTAEGINAAVIYHLRYGLAGAGFSEYAGLGAAAAAAAALCITALFLILRKRSAGSAGLPAAWRNPASLLCVCLSLAIQPAAAAFYRMLPSPSWSGAAAGGPGDQTLHAEFGSYYAHPTAAAKGPTRNLVFIYAESLERTYFDESLFPGLIRELRDLERAAVSFSDIEEAAGTGWTIAGMVASQCGIPLFGPADGNSMSGMDRFLPSATCLGDLLKRDGYRLAYYGGAPMRFGGKGKFYATHGFDEIAGRGELLGRLRDAGYLNAWGLFDDSLLDLAFDKYAELAGAKGKFALFLLTLDTHHPDGHLSRKCESMRYGDGTNPILNAVRCSDHLVADFVARIRRSAWGKDTVIVVASDHLAMRNSAHDLLKQKARKNLFMVIDPRDAGGRRVATTGSTLDIGPTVMSFLGYEARIGLGRNLMDAGAEASSGERAYIRGRLADWSEPLSRFWGFPKIERSLEVDAENRVVNIDGRPFSIPLLIELDAGLQTVIRFPGDGISTLDLVRANGGGGAFLLLAACSEKDATLPLGRICLFAGQGDQFRAQLIVEEAARFSPPEIRRMTGAGS